ncbi:hypothetical protein D3C71_1781480 [compost metagenome]
MRQAIEFALRMLDRADIAEHRHIVTELAVVIVDGADGLPLRIDLATLAPVPDFPAPFALGRQGVEHVPVERGVVAP